MKPIIALLFTIALLGCSSNAKVASENLSKAADNFEISRRVVFYNGITGEYILVIEGMCSKTDDNGQRIAITCKVGREYKKHFLGLSDNVTYFIEQVEPFAAGTDHYVVNFKPSAIIPDVKVR